LCVVLCSAPRPCCKSRQDHRVPPCSLSASCLELNCALVPVPVRSALRLHGPPDCGSNKGGLTSRARAIAEPGEACRGLVLAPNHARQLGCLRRLALATRRRRAANKPPKKKATKPLRLKRIAAVVGRLSQGRDLVDLCCFIVSGFSTASTSLSRPRWRFDKGPSSESRVCI
jgi:hypothetical protein